MAKKTQRRQISPAALRPTPAQLSGGRPMPTVRELDPDAPPLLIYCITWVHIIALFVIVLAMTPLTNNLDDIKQTIYHVVAPVQMMLALAALLLGAAPKPDRLMCTGLIGYGLVMVVSTLAGRFHWMGWDQVIMNWGAAGLFLSAFCAGAWRQTGEIFLKFLTVLWMVVCLIGFAMFDFFNSGQHMSIVGWLYRTFYGPNYAGTQNNMYALLLTLNNADEQMQSTILNRDFMAGISLLFLPFPLLLLLDPGRTRHTIAWRAVGAVTAMLTILAIFYCRSKGEYLVTVVVAIYLIGMFLKAGHLPTLRRRHIVAGLASVGIVLATLFWMNSPTLFAHLKTLNTSVSSRSIMWNGAWKIFQDYPILGGGPGSYRVYFSQYRAPDYFLHEIANVTTYSHNYFLDLLSETGFLGFVCFILFLGTLWLRGFWQALTHPDGRNRMLMITCTASVMGMFGSNMSSPNARWIIGASTLWTVMGYMAGSLRQGDDWRNEPVPPPGVRAKGAWFPAWGTRAILGTATAIGLLMLVISPAAGINYFRSALKYADGLRYMEGGLREYNQAGPESMERMARMMEESVYHFEDSLKADPTNVSAFYKVGSVYSTLSRVYEGYAQQSEANNKPEQAKQFAATANRLDKLSRERYEKLDELMPDYAEIHFNFGIVYDRYATQLRREAQAITDTSEAATAEKQRMEKEARAYDKRALDALERMHQLSIKAEVFQMLGGQYIQMNMLEKAQQTYREAATRYPDNEEVIRKYHDVSVMMNDIDGMLEALTLLWNTDKQNAEILNRLLQTELDNRKVAQLDKTLASLEELNPLDPRIFAARAMRAKWNSDQRAILDQAERYRLVGGRQPEVYQLAASAARQLGQGEMATAFEQEMARSAGTAPARDATRPLVLD